MSNGLTLPWYRRLLLVGPLVLLVLMLTVLVVSLVYINRSMLGIRTAATAERLTLAARQAAGSVRPFDLPMLRADPPLAGYGERISVRLEELRPILGVDRIDILDTQFRILASSARIPPDLSDRLAASVGQGLTLRAEGPPPVATRIIGGKGSTSTIAIVPLPLPDGGTGGYVSVRGSGLAMKYAGRVNSRVETAVVVTAGILILLPIAFLVVGNRPLSRLVQAAGRLHGEGLQEPVPVAGVGEVRALAEALEGLRRRAVELETTLGDDVRRQRERAERLEVLSDFYLAHIPVGTAVITATSVLHLNGEGRRILGLNRPEDLLGTGFGRQLVSALLKGRETRHEEITLEREGEASRVIAYSLSVLPASVEDGEGPTGFAVFSDATSSREAEEIRRLTANLAAVGDLAAGMAHEIRNPLGAIRDLIDVLEGGVDSEEERREIMAQVRTEVQGINKLIESLLAASRPTPGEWETVSLAALAREVEAEWRARRIEPPAMTGLDLPAAVSGDPELLKRVLSNLVDNARAASPGDVRVVVEEDETAGECRWRVVDAGAGIPEPMLGKVFLPFVSSRPGGTGLGLYLVHRIVAAHGGRIHLRNRNPGVEAIVTLPRKEA